MEIHQPKRVLIVCTGNSCRSQMAEALWNHLAGGQWRAFSAGTEPAGVIDPHAISALAEFGLDIRQRWSKSIDLYVGQTFHLVVTVCDGARAACPVYQGAERQVHWPFPDPSQLTGSESDRLQATRRVRDEIAARIRRFLAEEEPAAVAAHVQH